MCCCPTGACCFDDGSCNPETETQCGNDGGDYQGDGNYLFPNPCAAFAMGACCSGGTCSITTRSLCSGNYLGDGTTCVGVDCSHGACCTVNECLLNASCSHTTHGACTGTYLGDGSVCNPSNPNCNICLSLLSIQSCVGCAVGCTSASTAYECCNFGFPYTWKTCFKLHRESLLCFPSMWHNRLFSRLRLLCWYLG